MKKNIILFLLLAALAGAAYSESMLSISLDVYKNDSVIDKGVKIINNDATGTILPGDYLLRISDEKNKSLWERKINLAYIILSDPPVSTDDTSFEVIVPYAREMRHAEFYRKEKLLFAGDIEICNGDSRCDILREDYLSCPADCPIDKPEGICLAYADGVCDPDCLSEIDPDCNASKSSGVVKSEDQTLLNGLNGSTATNQTGDKQAEGNRTEKTRQDQQDPGYVYYLPYVAAVFLVIACLLYVSGKKHIRKTKPAEESSEEPYS